MRDEAKFQRSLISEIKEKLPGCIVFKNDAKQGYPDLMILHGPKWAALEVKASLKARKKPRPNQDVQVERMNEMSFSSFIFPENKEEVLNELTIFMGKH